MLNSKILGQGPPLLILHGLFGALDNWQTLARRFGDSRTCVLLDLRNHGKSPHYPTHGYEEMAGDVVEFLDANGIHVTDVLGHSMGGKVAMRFTLDHPARVRKLVVVDMGAHAYPSGHDAIFEAMRSLPLSQNRSRAELDALLQPRIPEPGIRQFLLKNLRREREGYAWKLNLDVIEREYPRLLGAIGGPPVDTPALFIRGGDSPYIRDDDWPHVAALFPNAELATVTGAGHWVHAERPDELYGLVEGFL